MCCTRLTGNTGRKNDAKNCHLRNIAQLCRALSSQLRHASTIGKNLLSSNISPTCPYNMVNFGTLVAEIVSLVWGTLANFNGLHTLAALLHSQTAALNRGRHLYSAGRPSRWALAHISSYYCYCQITLACMLSTTACTTLCYVMYTGSRICIRQLMSQFNRTTYYLRQGGHVIIIVRLSVCYRQHCAQRKPAGIKFTQRPILRFFVPQGRHVASIGVKFGTEEETFSVPNFTPTGATKRV